MQPRGLLVILAVSHTWQVDCDTEINSAFGRMLINRKNTINTMNSLTAKGDWNVAKGKLKQKWAQLTDDDLQYSEGMQDELIGRIQKRTGERKEAVEAAVKDACSCC